MIVLGIAAVWLALAAAGFQWLSLLDRAAAREERQAVRTAPQSQTYALPKARVPISKALLG
ncbi:MAG TPA: hypothetical protein VMG80_04415 [Solirubrobacteraceae bacterium]|nr:hypothetical protein [Solirubrobacteraceae bacterium]